MSFIEPRDAMRDDVIEAFARFSHQHPIAVYQQRTADGRALRVSDFISRRALHRLDLYDLVFQPLEVEYQLVVGIAPPPVVIGLAFNRGRRDFTARGCARLDAARPFLITAYAGAAARERAGALLAALDRAPALGTPAVALVRHRGQLESADQRAAGVLAALDAQGLGDTLRDWVRGGRGAGPLDAADDRPLTLTRGRDRTRVRYLRRVRGELDGLLIEPLSAESDCATLERLGLTGRQAEALLLARARLAPAEIAATLGISARTLDHHLEAIYRRLGVDNRAAAVRVADAALSER